jgi:hypothetical protein
MKKLLCYSSLMLFLMLNSFGQQSIHVGLPRDYFGYYAAEEVGSQWCWAASLQMIFSHYGIHVQQQQIINRAFGNHLTDDLTCWDDSLQVIQSNIKNWIIDENGLKYKIHASFTIGAPTASFLIDELTNLRPVLIGYKSGDNIRALVITACNYIQNAWGMQIQEIEVRTLIHPDKILLTPVESITLP